MPPTEADEKQVGGSHYKTSYQHWDFSHDVEFGNLEYQISKYVTRWRKKGGLQDLKKAKHFLQKLRENQVQWSTATLTEYTKANALTSTERWLILCLIRGDLPEATIVLDGLIFTEEDKAPTAHAPRELSERESAEERLATEHPDDPPGTYSWRCFICKSMVTVPGTPGGNKMLQAFVTSHQECKRSNDLEPEG